MNPRLFMSMLYLSNEWGQWRSEPDNSVPLCKVIIIHFFTNLLFQLTVNICIAGLNRRADYATERGAVRLLVQANMNWTFGIT